MIAPPEASKPQRSLPLMSMIDLLDCNYSSNSLLASSDMIPIRDSASKCVIIEVFYLLYLHIAM